MDDEKREIMNYPSNSHKKREEKPKEKKMEKVTKGKVITRKKSLWKRFTETFVGEDIDNVFSYILHDVMVPAAKETISNMVQGGIEMLLFGEKKNSRTRRDGGRSYVSYNNYSSRDRRDDRREISSRNRARHNFDDIIFSSRGDAEEVLGNLVDLTIDYGEATVGALYDFAGLESTYADAKYGWTDLRSASVSRVRDGYVLNLPKTILLD